MALSGNTVSGTTIEQAFNFPRPAHNAVDDNGGCSGPQRRTFWPQTDHPRRLVSPVVAFEDLARTGVDHVPGMH